MVLEFEAGHYSLYLIHNPLSGASFFMMKMVLGDSAASYGASLAITVIVCVASAFAMWAVIERPFITLSSKDKAADQLMLPRPSNPDPHVPRKVASGEGG